MTRQYFAGPPVDSVLDRSEYLLLSCFSVSALLTKVFSRTWFTSPSGISSIKLMSICLSMANCTKSKTSSSLVPRINTVLSLMPSKPVAIALSIPASTLFKSPVRVIALKRSAFRLSTEMLMRLTPDFFSPSACLLS